MKEPFNMKKIILLCIVIVLTFSACTNTNNTNKTATEDTEVTYENPHMMEQLKKAFNNGDYATVEKVATEINEKYPDSVDSLLAESYLKIVNEWENEEEEKVADVDFRNNIQILSASTDTPSRSGGVDLHIKWKNTSDKTVKYITFACNLYNAVDDMVACDLKKQYTFRGKVTGPIEPGTIYGDNTLWENAWWNNSGKYPKIIGIEIEYMDGTEIEIPESRINELFY